MSSSLIPKVTQRTAHGTNPELLIEKILRMKIYDHAFWKEHCFALTATTLLDKATQLSEVGGTFGGARKPTTFICLALKMLQIAPEQEIAAAYVAQRDFKYVRALGAFYLRLTASPVDVYRLLEPLYADYRRLRLKSNADIRVCHLDEFVEQLLTSSYCCDVALPHLPARAVLEEQGALPPRVSPLDAELDDVDDQPQRPDDDNDDDARQDTRRRSVSRSASRSVSRSPVRSVSRSPVRSVSRSPSPPVVAAAAVAKPKLFVKGLKQKGAAAAAAAGAARSGAANDVEEMNALRAKLGLKPLGAAK